MTLLYAPSRLPSLEPVKAGIIAALNTYLPDAFDAVDVAYPSPVIALEQPAALRQATIVEWRLVTVWPTVTVTGSHLRRTRAMQQPGAGEWEGDLELTYYVKDQDADRLAISLDRYGLAMWLALLSGQPFGGLATLIEGSEEIEPSEPGGATLNARAVALRCSVRLRT